MKKSRKNLFFALSSLIMLGVASGCATNDSKGNQNESSLSSSDDKKQVYVLPTKLGRRYLRGGSKGIHPVADVWRSANDGSYHMVIDASTVKGEYVSFNKTGAAYDYNDIDVRLFGIGTNLNNTSTADTLLYATLDADMAVETGETTSEESTPTIEENNIVTGVEYAYGTGPIKVEFNNAQLLWLKTTVMEQKDGIYVANPTTDIKFTPVYITLKDTIAPTAEDFRFDVDYSVYAEKEKDGTLNDYVEHIVRNEFKFKNEGEIDKDETPTLESVTIDEHSRLYAGDALTGKFTLSDTSGNVSEPANFTINILKDFDNVTPIELPYYKTLKAKNGKAKTMEFLKENIMSTAYEWKHLDASNVEINDFDSLYEDLNDNLKEYVYMGLNGQTKSISVSFAKYGYYFSKENENFTFNIKIIDDRPVSGNDVNFERPTNLISSTAELESRISFVFTHINSINDDFKDEYTAVVSVKKGDEKNMVFIYFCIFDKATFSKLSDKDCIPTYYSFYDSTERGEFELEDIYCDLKTGEILKRVSFDE